MEPGDRVKIIRKEAGLTQEKFGERLGVSKVAISKIESKVNSLSDQMCRSICREFNINKEWLLTGKGNMRTRQSMDLIIRLSDEYGLDPLETAILKEYIQLTPETKRRFREYLNGISERLMTADGEDREDS